jgi:hypothetical protein
MAIAREGGDLHQFLSSRRRFFLAFNFKFFALANFFFA